GREAAPGNRGRRERDGDRRVRLRHEREGAVRHAVREGPHRHGAPRARRQPQRLPRWAEPLLPAPGRRLPERDLADRRRRHLHREGRGVGAVTTVRLEEVDPIELPQGSWSRMLVTDAHVDGNTSSLGYSVFTPGTVLSP